MMFDHDQLQSCIQCGLCLSSCPTYDVTHLEQHNPRGRITAMRLRAAGEVSATDPGYIDAIDTCIQCRACESACPSGVPFGRLIEEATHDVAVAQTRLNPRALLARLVARRVVLRVASVGLALLQLARLDRLVPRRLRIRRRILLRHVLRRLPRTREPNGSLFLGCVMGSMFREVHDATVRVASAAGYSLDTRGPSVCCGALHLHAGDRQGALRQARLVIARFRGTTGPIVVNSAGCGAALKEYGELMGTPEAAEFSSRVKDVSEIIEPEQLAAGRPQATEVAVQVPCHLENVQGLSARMIALLAAIPQLKLHVLDSRCCGAGGIFSVIHPEFSDPLRDAKLRQVEALRVSTLVSANPGCALQLQDGRRRRVRHPVELLADSLTVM